MLNVRLFYIALGVIWLGVAVLFLLIGPQYAPQTFTGTPNQRLLGYGAFVFAAWNLLRWWMIRSQIRYQQDLEASYRLRVGPLAPRQADPEVKAPEFVFEEEQKPTSSPKNSNGQPH